MSLILQCVITALVAAALLWLICRTAYQRGYEAGQLDARLARMSTSTDNMMQRMCEAVAAMATGFALGYKQAKAEKVQNAEKNDILKNLN